MKVSHQEQVSFTARLLCARHGAVLHTIRNPYSNLQTHCSLPHLTAGETEAQRGSPTRSRPQSVLGCPTLGAARRDGNEAAPQRPQLPVGPEGWPEPSQKARALHTFSNSFKLLRKNTPNSEARPKAFCMCCQDLTLF